MFPSLYNWRKEGFLPCCDWRCGFTWCHFTVVTRGRVEAVPSVSPEKHQSHRPLARPAAWTQEDQSYSRAMRMGLRLIEKYCSASLTWDCIAGIIVGPGLLGTLRPSHLIMWTALPPYRPWPYKLPLLLPGSLRARGPSVVSPPLFPNSPLTRAAFLFSAVDPLKWFISSQLGFSFFFTATGKV